MLEPPTSEAGFSWAGNPSGASLAGVCKGRADSSAHFGHNKCRGSRADKFRGDEEGVSRPKVLIWERKWAEKLATVLVIKKRERI